VIFGKPWDLFAAVSQFATGVQLFMVLSGFCLFWPLCKSADALAHWDWKEYGWRRLRRIVPPYYAAIIYAAVLPMVLVLIFRMLGMRANWQPMPTAWQLIAHLLFIHTLFPGTWAGITGAFWSLGLEAQFYVVFPLVIFAFRKWRFRVIAAMIVSSVLFRAIIGLVIPTQMKVWEIVLSISFLAHWMQFATGMLVAWLVAKDWREGRERGVWTGAAGRAGALHCGHAKYLPGIAFVPADRGGFAYCVLWASHLCAVHDADAGAPVFREQGDDAARVDVVQHFPDSSADGLVLLRDAAEEISNYGAAGIRALVHCGLRGAAGDFVRIFPSVRVAVPGGGASRDGLRGTRTVADRGGCVADRGGQRRDGG